MPSPGPRPRIILHADDLGISYQVNDTIFYLMDQGLLTSASILANGSAFEDAVRRSHHFPHCSFGVHLNLTEFHPLRPASALAPFLHSDGTFRSATIPIPCQNATRRAVLEEWTAQVHRVREAGVPISHIDSHHHVHTRLSLLGTTRRLCREQDIRRVRIRHTFGSRHNLAPVRIDSHLCNFILRRAFLCTDEFGPFSGFASVANRLREDAKVELMVHPGHPTYRTEIDALQRIVNREFHERYECITYRDLL